ncbi:hypothetical protein ELI13_35060 [Rhizobium ruizarguesonis]|uniref:DKNYY family protein n=1 Tax=Rhizobium ruizarguesonis TaxID=2081791 RepID=A0ABY1WWQ9_9HYPH|nr:hypothetical protein [Rhizobium ruizarguesonis]TAU60717.1 hypothetical protein ELI46_33470 [Rhizobium ruizarguesonis]TAV19773.1 hypothetical protein ELI36_35715 [Rhizobium ruizarguesonis]TAV21481.1 hypothetical protein ELI35_32115 [Rhizobium ruizarguesonis]TAV25668.1 hypothetical protein ELI33_26305 [Rhizobium ruizarguesonis]TAW05716.1 hypothetical protein ELI25_33150 [Rhizobium ruizarguesonis]
MKPFDPLRLDCAIALAKDTFCVVFSGKDYEDLVYEGQLEQPWSRSDVPRKIDSLAGRMGEDGRPVIYALSDEGDVYTLPAGKASSHRKIAGAGVYSDDATDLGYVNSTALIGDALFVTGYHSQLYRLTNSGLGWFHKEKLPQAPETYDYLVFGDLNGPTDGDLYMNVTYSPTSTTRELTEEEDEEMGRLFLAGRNEEAVAIRRAADGPSRVLEGRLYHWDGRIIAKPRSGKYYPEPATLSDIFIESAEKVWAVGGNGVILCGNAEHGFQDVSLKGNNEKLHSITKFKDRMVIASDYALHWFDGHLLSRLKPILDPSINRNIPNPLKVQAVDDVRYYFDSKHGVHTFDGDRWTEIEIPPELLERDFRGLPSKPR